MERKVRFCFPSFLWFHTGKVVKENSDGSMVVEVEIPKSCLLQD